MPSASATRAIDAVLAHEGGYVDHPSDPGGATNRGITLAVLSEYRGMPVKKDDVRALSECEAREIYEARYWTPIHGDELPPAVAYVTMDAAANSGVTRAVRWLQWSVGVACDGKIGPLTLYAAKISDPARTVETCCATRLEFLQSLKTWPTFGRGWERRVREVEAAALKLT